MKILFVSLGCDKNLVDSEKMLGMLQEKGYTFTDDEAEADVVVVNTCCFIGDAKRIDKNIVQYNVGKTSDKHSRHRKSGSSVVSHKTKKKIVSEKERGEEKQYADVVGGVTDRVVIGAEYGGNLF